MRISPAAARLPGTPIPSRRVRRTTPVRRPPRDGSTRSTPSTGAGDRLVRPPGVPGHARTPSRPYADPVRPLHPELAARLAARGIDRLYTHQAAAIDALRDGRSVVLATGTASGKSLCYQVPIVESRAARRRRHRAAGVPDQGAGPGPAAVACASGSCRRSAPRPTTATPAPTTAPASASTPTSCSPTPRCCTWASCRPTSAGRRSSCGCATSSSTSCTRCAGSSAATSRTCCAGSGACARTTAPTPDVLLRERDDRQPGRARERAVRAAGRGDRRRRITAGRSARSRCWQRPLLDERTGTRASANVETAELVARFVGRRAPDPRVHPQPQGQRDRRRAGPPDAHRPARRRREHRRPYPASRRTGPATCPRSGASSSTPLTTGELAGVVATSALELGIDVGGLDAVVVNGFPGTLASLRQQAGRAGRDGRRGRGRARRRRRPARPVVRRATRPSCSARDAEAAVVNPDNPFVLRPQVGVRGARAAPLDPRRREYFGDGLDDAVRDLVLDDLLKPRDGRMYWAGREPPAPRGRAALRIERRVRARRRRRRRDRGASTRRASSTSRIPARSTCTRAASTGSRSSTPKTTARWSSRPTTPTSTRRPARAPTSRSSSTARVGDRVGAGVAHLGHGRGHQPGRRVPAQADVDERADRGRRPRPPASSAHHRARAGTRCRSRRSSRDGVAPGRVLGTVHAAEHALIGLLPLFTICDRWDVGGVSMALHPQTGEPTIFVYDGYPGGAGIADLAFDRVAEHVHAAPRARRRVPRATTAARRACSRRSAATGTSTSTRPARCTCSGSSPDEPGTRRARTSSPRSSPVRCCSSAWQRRRRHVVRRLVRPGTAPAPRPSSSRARPTRTSSLHVDDHLVIVARREPDDRVLLDRDRQQPDHRQGDRFETA